MNTNDRKKQLEYFINVLNASSHMASDYVNLKDVFNNKKTKDFIKNDYIKYIENNIYKIDGGYCDAFQELKNWNNDKNPNNGDKTPLNVVIILKSFIENEKDNPEKKIKPVFLINATINSNGYLNYPVTFNGEINIKLCCPWFIYDYVDSYTMDNEYIAKQADIDEFLDKTYGYENIFDWESYIKYALKMYDSITEKSKKQNANILNNVNENKNIYILKNTNVNTTFFIQEFYNRLKEEKNFDNLKLLNNILNDNTINLTQAEVIKNNDYDGFKKHCGQMRGDFPLSPSQRKAVSGYLKICDGEVLAVNGPAGTGKTTLLQSIVADMVVSHALKKQDAPVIIASSTNNKAITNIIDSFGKINSRYNSLDEHWIEGAKSFATFFPSQTILKDYIVEKYDKIKYYEVKSEYQIYIKTGSYSAKKSKYNINNLFPSNINKNIAVEALKSKLTDTNLFTKKELKEISKISDNFSLLNVLYKKLCDIEKLRKKCVNIYKKIDKTQGKIENNCLKRHGEICNKFRILKFSRIVKKISGNKICKFEIDKYKNTKNKSQYFLELFDEIRYIEFWLAVHYYEVKWLTINSSAENCRYNNFKDELENTYKNLAMLSPCLVMTNFMVPYNFNYKNKEDKEYKYLYNFADLLIIDEAGTITPEIGMASFAFAKKAVVVGDEKQLPPIWNITKKYDEIFAKIDGLSIDKMVISGLNCSQSSVMKVAKNVCAFKDKDDKGIFLSEHRRCYKDIIEYCNELIYNGCLEPLKPNPDSLILPPMDYIQVDTDKSTNKNGSRYNQKEINCIIDWLTKNYNFIKEKYNVKDNKEEKELLGIITPFKAQADEIDENLKNLGYDNIEVGTVHTFQGAEKNVILFSGVYGKNDDYGYNNKNSFINKNLYLLNVAVSRAKDSFIFVGDFDCIIPSNDTDIPVQFLKNYYNNKIESNNFKSKIKIL